METTVVYWGYNGLYLKIFKSGRKDLRSCNPSAQANTPQTSGYG